ncbi:uncharacterized protein KQ657_001659 [Scheffersomyces spartinae]|uniref:Uracil-DNA glycosylase-like domain-containing protein n=1 Tax=Scheffersomyces spartinae TaxID=45513 RepID=A0A9P7V720_9ASCO|nr:uncharacterized protein KQ657_001659 [Scheffersomyces spartinae]KAG7192560.1 hypothetical protein KQ657_001659 [Scheffersomyces spartinae]
MDESIRKQLARFRNHDDGDTATKYRISKPHKTQQRKSVVPTKKVKKQYELNSDLKDLQPSLDKNLVVVFIGFNPGIQSSIQQHHYAHHSNLFWKLFNQSKILPCVLERLMLPFDDYSQWIRSDGSSAVKASDDFELVKCKIGFTDLVLRCTKEALELSFDEKMANVPRLILEFSLTNVENIVVVGKGIWEIVVKYLSKSMGIKFKLTKSNFDWGLQSQNANDSTHKDPSYTQLLRTLLKLVGHKFQIFVFPNTSGLVTTMKFDEKLQLWLQLGEKIKLSIN